MATFTVGDPIEHPVHGHCTVDFVFVSTGRVGLAFEGGGYLLLNADRLQAELDGKSLLPPSRVTVPTKLKKPSLRALLAQSRFMVGPSRQLIPPVDAERHEFAAVDGSLRQLRELLQGQAPWPVIHPMLELNMCTDCLMHNFDRWTLCYMVLINGEFARLVADHADGEAVKRAVDARLLETLDELRGLRQQADQLPGCLGGFKVRELLIGAFDHTSSEIKATLRRLAMARANPFAALGKRLSRKAADGRIARRLGFRLTPPPQFKVLDAWLMSEFRGWFSLASAPVVLPPPRPANDGFLSKVATVAIGVGLADWVFGHGD